MHIINFFDEKTGELLFDAHKFNQTIEDTLYRNDILITRKKEIHTGKFFKETIYKKGIGTIPVKENMPVNLYGGYSNMVPSYLCLVKYKNKQKLIGIPTQIFIKEKKEKQVKINFIKQHLSLKEEDPIEISKDYIPFESELIFRGQNTYIKGYSIRNKNCELCNAKQLKIEKSKMKQWMTSFEYILHGNKNFEEDGKKYIDQIFSYLFNQKEKFPLFYKELQLIEETVKENNFDIEEKVNIIKEIFKILHCNSSRANLKVYGLKDSMGRLSGFNITEEQFINKSISGVKERKPKVEETKYEF